MWLKNILRLVIMLIVVYGTINCNPKQTVDEERAKKGETLFNNTGCTKCHSISGEKLYGPPLDRITGTEAAIIRDGTTITVKRDRRYIIRSITRPELDKLTEYQDRVMPPVNLSREESEQIADYLIYINSAGNAE